MKKIKASFSIPIQFPVIFVDNIFKTEQDVFSSFITQTEQPVLVLPIIEQGVVDHHPTIIADIMELLIAYQLVPVSSLVLQGGEEGKNKPEQINIIVDKCIEQTIDRHSYILAIGGGAFIDMVGYAASITHRGVRLIRMPTTVLAQNDAGIGVKNAINYKRRKNFLGTFTPPQAVINDFHFLDTLTTQDKRAGIAEAIKVALIKNQSFFGFLYASKDKLKIFAPVVMKKMIMDCAQEHLLHICKNGDPYEMGSARPLDFGHWSAHAFEEISGFELRHGEAVAIGILLDCYYSHAKGWLNEKEFSQVNDLISELGFPICIETLAQLNIEESLDNFRTHIGGQLCITMLKGIGKAFEVNEIDLNLMHECVNALIVANT